MKLVQIIFHVGYGLRCVASILRYHMKLTSAMTHLHQQKKRLLQTDRHCVRT